MGAVSAGPGRAGSLCAALRRCAWLGPAYLLLSASNNLPEKGALLVSIALYYV